jgi:hypothetical protein
MEEANQAVNLNSEPASGHKRGGFRPGAGRKPNRPPRGGSRPGAGRKRNPLQLMDKPGEEIARAIYEESNPRDVFARLLRSKSHDVQFRTITFLHEQAFGKAKQAVDVSGSITHAHTVYRNPHLAALSIEELQALDNITKKLVLPAPDGPHNHTKSNTEANVIDVECQDVGIAQNASNCEIESPTNE